MQNSDAKLLEICPKKMDPLNPHGDNSAGGGDRGHVRELRAEANAQAVEVRRGGAIPSAGAPGRGLFQVSLAVLIKVSRLFVILCNFS